MIEAGSETTSQALNNTIVGLLSNPEAVRQCHEELDRVIGDDRTPTFEDLHNLPHIWACVKVPPLLPPFVSGLRLTVRKRCAGGLRRNLE
jgi:cytochrome P450